VAVLSTHEPTEIKCMDQLDVLKLYKLVLREPKECCHSFRTPETVNFLKGSLEPEFHLHDNESFCDFELLCY